MIKVEPPGAGDALRSLRMVDESGTSLWWRSYVSGTVCLSRQHVLLEPRSPATAGSTCCWRLQKVSCPGPCKHQVVRLVATR